MIDFGQKILDVEGKEIPRNKDDDTPLTLGYIAATALFSALPDDERVDVVVKWGWGALGARLYQGGEQDLTAKEITTIQERIGKVFSPLIIFRACELLEQKDKEK